MKHAVVLDETRQVVLSAFGIRSGSVGLPLRSCDAKSRSLSSTLRRHCESKSGKSRSFQCGLFGIPAGQNRVDALDPPPRFNVGYSDHRERITKCRRRCLVPAARERCAVLNAGKRKLRPRSDRLDVVKEGAETKVKTIHVAGIKTRV